MPESTQEKLSRVRKPRVHITYEVETDGARVIKELPFVMGVIGNFSGSHPTQQLRPLEERKFVEINRDNFDSVMKRMGPGLQMSVENTIEGNGTTIPVQLAFNSMSDFEPANVIKQVEPLTKLLETRNRLRDLISKVDRSTELETILGAGAEEYGGSPEAVVGARCEERYGRWCRQRTQGRQPCR